MQGSYLQNNVSLCGCSLYWATLIQQTQSIQVVQLLTQESPSFSKYIKCIFFGLPECPCLGEEHFWLFYQNPRACTSSVLLCACAHIHVCRKNCVFFQSDLQFGRETLPINNLNPRLLLRTEVGQNACLWVTQRYDIGCSFLIQVETEETKLSVQ